MSENQFPSEVIDLPSEGKVYSKDSPLANGKLELKYMTAKEEDILTSANLIRKGLVLDKLLDQLILTKGIKSDDLILGDKNAIMVAARVLAYGPEYTCEVTHPDTGVTKKVTINLADCPFKHLPDDIKYDKGTFEVELPISKAKVECKFLTGIDEKSISKDIKASKKVTEIVPELTTRLRYSIKSIDGDSSPSIVNNFVHNMLAKDSLFLRQEMKRITPDIILKQEVEIGGDTVEVDIPMTVNFFWPSAEF